MPTDDLKQYATSSVDFYELLGITPASDSSEIRRAYRKTALKFHPDKNADNPSAVETFHLLQIAYDVLSDPEVKALYDNARSAREAKKRQHELFEGKRRQMKEDLERRESGVKRKRDDEVDEQERLDREIRRLAEDGKRRRKEREEMLSREKLEEEVRRDEQTPDRPAPSERQNGASELDRSVKVRWAREGKGEALDKAQLTGLFSRFGEVESLFLLKDKKKRIDGAKKLVATGVIVFASIVGAHAAITDIDGLKSEEPWKLFDMFWANEQDPAVERPSTPRTPESPKTPPSFGKRSFPGIGSMPTTPASSFSPSLEEMTMMRLKNAEKRRLEEQIRKSEAAEHDAEAGN